MFDRFFAIVYYAVRYFATGQAPTEEELSILTGGRAPRRRKPYVDYTLEMDDERILLLMGGDGLLDMIG